MLSIIAKWWIVPGREPEAVAALRELARAVEEQEPFTTMYLIHTPIMEGSRPAPPPNEVVFVSGWPDRTAFERHLHGPVFTKWIVRYLDLFLTGNDGTLYVSAEFIDRQAGYIRPAAASVPS
ncbi:MAG: antibiotic biosynthesis monooxygenase family protein [Acidimicrobiales bacterium]|jgi:quinol monooxygenase YgiN